MKTYKSYDRAARRVNTLIHSQGCWPGIVSHTNGTYSLTYDPQTEMDDEYAV